MDVYKVQLGLNGGNTVPEDKVIPESEASLEDRRVVLMM